MKNQNQVHKKKSKSTIAKLLKNKYYPLNILKFFPGYIFPSQ